MSPTHRIEICLCCEKRIRVRDDQNAMCGCGSCRWSQWWVIEYVGVFCGRCIPFCRDAAMAQSKARRAEHLDGLARGMGRGAASHLERVIHDLFTSVPARA